MAFASRTIVSPHHRRGRSLRNSPYAQQYTINKSKLLLGFIGPHWKQRVVAELDSALNKWVDTIPPHREHHAFLMRPPTHISIVRWNPEQPDPVFLNQSATLHASYYHTQICVHRQFIPATPSASSEPPAALPSPSLAICVTAARACLRVLRVQLGRTQRCTGALAAVHTPLFAAGLVRLLGWWAGGRTDEGAAADVKACVGMLTQIVP